jgi:mRNA-degrading endonuclease RelE of RelBE toxin-antitoxin system
VVGRKTRYEIEITREADQHLSTLNAGDRTRVLELLETRLAFEPRTENRNRKRLRPNPVAPWELRLGKLRVYFDVEDEPIRVVRIHAVGVKDRDRLWIGGEEVRLS